MDKLTKGQLTKERELELKLLTYFAVGVAIIPLVFIACALLYVLIK